MGPTHQHQAVSRLRGLGLLVFSTSFSLIKFCQFSFFVSSRSHGYFQQLPRETTRSIRDGASGGIPCRGLKSGHCTCSACTMPLEIHLSRVEILVQWVRLLLACNWPAFYLIPRIPYLPSVHRSRSKLSIISMSSNMLTLILCTHEN